MYVYRNRYISSRETSSESGGGGSMTDGVNGVVFVVFFFFFFFFDYVKFAFSVLIAGVDRFGRLFFEDSVKIGHGQSNVGYEKKVEFSFLL